MKTVFPNAIHGYCIYHICQNLKASYKFDDDLIKLYFIAAKAYRPSEFYDHFLKLKSLSPRGAEKLKEIGFDKWARSHFPGKRFNIMTTNIAESGRFQQIASTILTAERC